MQMFKRVSGLAAVFVLGLAASAQSAVMTQWTFESNPFPSGGGSPSVTTFTPLVPDTNTNTGTTGLTGVHATASTFTTTNVGNGSAHSLSANNWASGDYWQFDAGTGYAGEQVEFDQVSSATGPTSFTLAYATDGLTFLPFGTYSVSAAASNASFSSLAVKTDTPPRYLFDLSNVATISGAADVTFRLIDSGTTGSAGGTDRLDNVTVGTNLTPPTVPEPASLGIAAVAAAGLLGRRRAR